MADQRNILEGAVPGINLQDLQPLGLPGLMQESVEAQQRPYSYKTQKIRITPEQLALIKKTIFRDATDEELALFKHICELRQLDPFARQIYARKQRQFNYKTQKYDEAMVIITGIDGFRLIAERSKKYAGQLGPFFTEDGEKWLDAWIKDTPPKAVKVAVLRHDFKEPMWSMARFNAYCPHNDKGEPTGQWRSMPDGMIAKCAEALALRRAFPEELSGLYTNDEMQQAAAPIKTAELLAESLEEAAIIDAGAPVATLPTEGFLRDYPTLCVTIKQRIHDRFTELGISRLSQAKERYPEWPGNPDNIPMVALPAIAEAFGMEILP